MGTRPTLVTAAWRRPIDDRGRLVRAPTPSPSLPYAAHRGGFALCRPLQSKGTYEQHKNLGLLILLREWSAAEVAVFQIKGINAMRMFLRLAFAGMGVFAGAAALAGDTESISFTLKNESSAAVTKLYASPASKDDWEKEILGGQTLDPGESGKLTIDDGRKTCMYDLKAEFKDGSSLEKHNINFCELDSYTFTD
jgi:hypothetical protein